ncbi:FAD/NAD(P)-binding protein [Sphingomonas sp. NCPPB 2930]
MTKVAVIGAGCSGVLVCKALGVHARRAGISEVVLYEGSGPFGPGLAYGPDTTADPFILNMATSLLGVDAERPDAFLQWLKEVPGHPKIDPDGYVGRRLMGRYLTDELKAAERRLTGQGVRFRRVAHMVDDIERDGSGWAVHTPEAREPGIGKVVLAVGHLQKRTPFPASSRYFANPYHDLGRLRSAVSPGAQVGILGTKLTAVDMALLLGSMGVAAVHLYSNSGRLPLVRGLVPDALASSGEMDIAADSLTGFLRWFRRAQKYDCEYEGFFKPVDSCVRLRREIDAAQKVRDWQIRLDATKSHIDHYWSRLDNTQKRRFYRKYQGMWMSYRHPMPVINARKIEAMLRSGQLSIHRGYKATRIAPDGKVWVDVSDGTLTLDYAVDATGFAGNLTHLDSPLIERLLDRGLVKQCSHGGIAIDPKTHLAHGASGLYAIGPLTQGSLFYVSAIERLAVHAANISAHLAASAHPVYSDAAPVAS